MDRVRRFDARTPGRDMRSRRPRQGGLRARRLATMAATLLATSALIAGVPITDTQAADAAGHGPLILAQAATPDSPIGAPPPEAERRPEVLVAADVGGVLTPRGVLVLEPSLRYSNTSTRRFTFRGVELIDTVLIGLIEAEDSDRNFVEGALTARLGITERFELEFRVPGIYRNDRITSRIPQLGEGDEAVEISRSIDSFGLGDIEAAAHYQFNAPRGRSPILVGNLRAKFPTGKGPFDVDRDAFGVETELATGSGFYGIEPSLTVLMPADPVVFYGNLGYLWNIARSIDKDIGESRVGRVDPGDAIRLGFGMGFAITDQTSVSLGYSHDYILKTKTEIDGTTFRSRTLQVGVFSVGFSHRFSQRIRADVSIEIGATSEATDASVMFRLPISLQLF